MAHRNEIDTEWVFTDAEAMFAVTQHASVELGVVQIEQLDEAVAAQLQKIHLSCDADGYPLDFKITGG